MFHVEHGNWRIRAPAIPQQFMVYAGDKHLAIQILQQATQGVAMLLIQLRWQVIHQINTLLTPGPINQMPLSNTQCTHHQLLLAA